MQSAGDPRLRDRSSLLGSGSGRPESWGPFRQEFELTHRELWEAFNDWVVEQGAPALPDLEFMPRENAANIYVFPEEADYVGERDLDGSWHRIDSSVRRTEGAWDLPAALAERPEGSGLVYLSLGSLGGADVGLMQRLIDTLGESKHRFVVSMGPQAGELSLAPNMSGSQTLPQTRVLEQVDLVITHGGNNTTTEALHFGKPMVLLPLFWDQYDNAQRMHELGFGIRLSTYDHTPEELRGAIDTLLDDHVLRQQMATMGDRIRGRDGLSRGADLIEKVGLEHLRSAKG